MNIVFIGAGNLATHLSQALQQAGYAIRQVYSRTEASARTLALQLSCDYTTTLEEVHTDADVYIFSVKDQVLATLVNHLCPRLSDKVCLHTAGSVPLSVFESAAQRYGVLYPMQTFSINRLWIKVILVEE